MQVRISLEARGEESAAVAVLERHPLGVAAFGQPITAERTLSLAYSSSVMVLMFVAQKLHMA